MRTCGLVFLALTLAVALGCGGKSPDAKFEPVGSRIGGPGGPSTESPPAASDWKGGDRDKGGPVSREMKADAMVAGEAPRTPRRDKEPQSGTLTAGSFDDTLRPDVFRAFLDKFGQNRWGGDLTGRFRGHQLVVTVRGGDGQPVQNAKVTVASAGGRGAATVPTRTDGRAVFLASWDQVALEDDFTVTVAPPDGGSPVTQQVPRLRPQLDMTLPGVQGKLPRHLDLALVVDTTGSMGDEMDYLKSEIKSIAAAVHERFPQVQQRYALIVYKDQGDSYVTRSFDFTPSLDEFRRNLSNERASGGGDTPEAMHQAMADATQLRWRDGDTARVLFLVADAPPHDPDLGRTFSSADALRKRGVAIYPLAASGYDPPCEFVMRGCALLTGGQFLFLTDDSGVGNPHAEPHITDYHVQRLDQMMIRMIAGELSGKRLDPKPNEIIRTVGKPRSAALQ